MARRIAFALYKGGVGKTTVFINLAVAMSANLREANPNARILLIDADTQAGATLLLTGRKLKESDPSVSTLLAEKHTFDEVVLRLDDDSAGLDEVAQEALAGLDLIPASPEGKLRVSAPEQFWGMRDLLDEIAQEHSYDYILLDCGYGDSDLTTLALVAADEVFAVTSVTALGANGLSQLLDKVAKMRRSFPHMKVATVIANDYSARETTDQQVLTDMVDQLGDLLWGPPIPHRAIVKRSHDTQLPLAAFSTPAARQLVEIFDGFAAHIIDQETTS